MPYMTVIVTFAVVTLVATFIAFSRGEVHRLIFVLLAMATIAAVAISLTVRIGNDFLFVAGLAMVGMAGFLVLVFLICISVPSLRNRPYTRDDRRKPHADQLDE